MVCSGAVVNFFLNHHKEDWFSINLNALRFWDRLSRNYRKFAEYLAIGCLLQEPRPGYSSRVHGP